jgi:hypothetical protein
MVFAYPNELWKFTERRNFIGRGLLYNNQEKQDPVPIEKPLPIKKEKPKVVKKVESPIEPIKKTQPCKHSGESLRRAAELSVKLGKGFKIF